MYAIFLQICEFNDQVILSKMCWPKNVIFLIRFEMHCCLYWFWKYDISGTFLFMWDHHFSIQLLLNFFQILISFLSIMSLSREFDNTGFWRTSDSLNIIRTGEQVPRWFSRLERQTLWVVWYSYWANGSNEWWNNGGNIVRT